MTKSGIIETERSSGIFFVERGAKENLARGVIHWRKICARRGRATDLFIGPTGDAAAKTRQ